MKGLTFHALRHFSATTLAGQGAGIRTIAGRLGHANPGLTWRTCAQFLDAAGRDAATAIGSAPDGTHTGVPNTRHRHLESPRRHDPGAP
jgi:hypothetical protein